MSKYFLTLLISGLFIFGYGQVPNLEWAKRMGSTSFDRPEDLAIDASGNVFTTGFFTTTADFDPGAGVVNLTSNGGRDIFLSKLDPDGNLIWVKQIGGATDDQGFAISIDNLGNIYLAGYFSGAVDFDPGAGTFNLTASGADMFLVKLDSNGDFLWANRTGSTNAETPYDLAVDGSGNIHMTGFFNGTVDFDPRAGIFNLTSAGTYDIFVTKLNTDGDLIWAKRIGGTELDEGRSIDVDGSGNVYTTGYFRTTVDFDPGAGVSNLTSGGGEDIFVSKLDVNGNFVWAIGMGDLNFDIGQGIKTDGTNVYVTGYFQGTADFNPTTGIQNLSSAGDRDIFVSKFDANGNLVWAKNMGGAARDDGSDIAIDASGNVYTTGFFNGTADFDPGIGVVNQTSSGGLDIFISKLNASGNFEWARRIGGSEWDQGVRIKVDGLGNIYSTGQYRASVDFDPGPCSQVLNANTQDEIFVIKLRQQALVGDPTITSFSPLSGDVGNTVTITGTNFDPVPTNNIVQFNGIVATVTSSSTTSITTTVPVGATTGKITVVTGCIGIQSVSNFTIGTLPSPTITSFTPTSGPVGTTVTITGTNFSATLADNFVLFNGVSSVVTASTTTTITTTVPAGATTGAITVTVAGNTATSATDFIVTSPGSLTITSFTPSSGPVGTTVMITGTNFGPTPSNNTVSFNGTTASVTSASATSLTVSVPAGATTGTISITVAGSTATSSTIFTVTTTTTNQAPIIASPNTTTTIGAMVSLDLTSLISDPDNNLDLSTLRIVSPPISGANAEIINSTLTIDYSGISFADTDRITIEVCDLLGSCTQQELIIEVDGDINVYTGVSPNGDMRNDIWFIQNIASLPDARDNTVSIYNRWGDLIFETTNYDNDKRVFTGVNKNGDEVPSGIYFYKIEFKSTRPGITGYLTLKK